MRRKPHATRVLCRSIIGRSKIDGNKKYNAARECECQEDGYEEMRWRLPQRKIMANGEEHEYRDCEERESRKQVGA
jgi:hypothetical protein